MSLIKALNETNVLYFTVSGVYRTPKLHVQLHATVPLIIRYKDKADAAARRLQECPDYLKNKHTSMQYDLIENNKHCYCCLLYTSRCV